MEFERENLNLTKKQKNKIVNLKNKLKVLKIPKFNKMNVDNFF